MIKLMQLSKQKTSHFARVHQQESSISTRLPDPTFSRGPPLTLPQAASQHRGSPALAEVQHLQPS